MIKACLLGKKLNYSLSPVIHKRFYEATGIKGSYELCETDEDGLDAAMKQLKKLSGANVTIPYKTAVMRYLDEISPEAEAIGAVNTIKFKGGKAFGFNTDYYGLKDTLEYHGISLGGKSVAILGTGGASKCAVKLAADLNAKEVITVSRSAKNGSISYEELEQKGSIDVLINTTPVGMYPDIFGRPVKDSIVENCGCVVDIVYNPHNTQLLRTAQAMGKKTAGGLRMLTSQAVKAQEIWNGKSFCRDVYDDVYDYVKNLKTNVVLIGMPGSGKSSIGKLVAEGLNKNFIDTDDLVTTEHGEITKIFADEGEAAFREYERKAALLASDIREAVTATGGGIILDERNIDALKKTGIMVFIDRPLNILVKETDGSGRPLIAGDNSRIKTLYKQRYPLYMKYADAVVTNDEDANKCVSEIIKIWGRRA